MMRNLDGIKKNLIFILFIIPAVMLMTSCPPQVTPDMVSLVEDELPPTITIESPAGGSNYYSEVTVTGFITDSVLEEDDEAGRITTIYYEIANDSFRKGKIDIGLDDSIVKDESFGSGDITYDLSNNEFIITFSTMVPNKFRDQISISITTFDSNDNITTKTLDLRENDGPYVSFDFYSDATYSEASRITNLNGTEVYLKGLIGNSEYQTDSASEIVRLDWGIFGTFWGGSLDLSEGSGDWVDYLGIYRSLNNDEDYYFDYNPETFTFNTHQSIELDNGMYFYVKATDSYGHVTEVQQLLSPPALLTLSRPTVDFPYYSPDNSATLTVTSKLIDPNDNSVVASDIGTVSYEFLAVNPADTAAVEAIGAIELYSNPAAFDGFFYDNGNFDFNVDTASLSGLVGDISVRVIVTDSENTTIPKKSVLLENDSVDPVISVTSFTDGDSDGYVRRNDGITLNFTISDSDSGIKSSSIVSSITGESISGTPIETNSTINPETGQKVVGYYTTSFTVPVSAISDIDGDLLGYSIQVTDNVGNSASYSLADQITFYSPYAATPYSGLTFSSDNAYNNGYVRAVSGAAATNSTLTVNFTSERVLETAPAVTIGGRTANISYDPGTRVCTASLKMDGTESASDGSAVPIGISFIDAAGNGTSSTPVTSIIYDSTAPAATPAPTWSGGTYMNADDMLSAISINVDTSNGSGDAAVKSGDTIELYEAGSPGTPIGTAVRGAPTTVVVSISNPDTTLGVDGPKSITSRIIDAAGNLSSDSPSLSVTKDIVVETAEAGDSYSGASSKISIFNQDASANYEVSDSLSGVSIANINWTVARDTGDGTCLYGKNGSTGALVITGFTPGISGTADGQYTATLNVTDGAGNSKSDSFSFILDADPLNADFTGISGVYENSELTLESSYTDNECGIASYNWHTAIAPGGSSPLFGSASSADSTFNTTGDGDYTIELTVTDSLGRTSSPTGTFTWETQNPYFEAVENIADKGPRDSAFSESPTATDDGSGVSSYRWVIDNTDGGNDYTSSTQTLNVSYATNGTQDGNYTATCYATDVAGNESNPGLSFNFVWDSQGPDISITGESPNPATAQYLMNGDTVTINFTATDDYSPVQTPTATIMGGSATIGGSAPSFTATRTLSGETSDADGTPATYSISCYDNLDAGTDNGTTYNPASAPYIFYGAYGSSSGYFYLSSPGITVDSSNNDGSYDWASIGDTITVQFTGTRELTGDPVVTIGEQTASISYNDADNTCTATLAVPDPATTKLKSGGIDLVEGDVIPVTISVTDAAGNSGAYTFDSDVRYDCVAPAKPATPTFPGSTVSGYINYDNIDGGSISLAADGITVPTSPSVITTGLYRASDNVQIASNTSTGNGVSFTVSGSPAEILTALGGQGYHEYYVKSVDSAGNESPASDNFTVTVDTLINTCEAGDSYSGSTSKTTGGWTQTSADAADDHSFTVAWSFYLGATPTANVTAANTSVTDVVITACSSDNTYTGRLTVTDAAGNSAYDTFTFVWDAGFTVSLSQPGSGFYNGGVILTATTASSECGVPTDGYAWSFTSDQTSPNVTFAPSNEATPTFTTNKDGQYVVTVVATDNISHTATSNTVTFIYDTTDPDCDLPNTATTTGGSNYTLTPNTATDNIDDPADLTYLWSYSGITVVSATAPELVITGYTVGSYTISLTITDRSGNSSSDSCNFNPTGDRAIGDSGGSILRMGGSSENGSASGRTSSTVGRIRTGGFASQPISTPSEKQAATPAPYTISRTSTVSYKGALYATGLPRQTESNGTETGVEDVYASDMTSDSTTEAISDANEHVPLTVSASGSRPSVITSSAAKASASIAENDSAASGETGTHKPARTEMLWLLLFAPAAWIILRLRKRRL